MPVNVVVGSRYDFGVSLPPFDLANVAGHVGDDVEAVVANRSELAARVGLAIADVVVMHPVHGADVVHVAAPTEVPMTALGRVAPPADVLITTSRGVGLITMGADCAPVTLVDDAAGVLAVVHVGWRGLVCDALGAAVSAMRDVGAHAIAMTVHPCICVRHYPVAPARADEAAAHLPAGVGVAVDGQPAIDLRAGLQERAQALGLSDVTIDTRCTWESADLFSHRRDSITGRHGVLAVLQ
jgi:polyphenol oxidase